MCLGRDSLLGTVIERKLGGSGQVDRLGRIGCWKVFSEPKEEARSERSGDIGHLNLPRNQRIGSRTLQQTENPVSGMMTGKTLDSEFGN